MTIHSNESPLKMLSTDLQPTSLNDCGSEFNGTLYVVTDRAFSDINDANRYTIEELMFIIKNIDMKSVDHLAKLWHTKNAYGCVYTTLIETSLMSAEKNMFVKKTS